MSLPSRLLTLPLQVLVIPPGHRGSAARCGQADGRQHAPRRVTDGFELPFIAGPSVINPTCDS